MPLEPYSTNKSPAEGLCAESARGHPSPPLVSGCHTRLRRTPGSTPHWRNLTPADHAEPRCGSFFSPVGTVFLRSQSENGHNLPGLSSMLEMLHPLHLVKTIVAFSYQPCGKPTWVTFSPRSRCLWIFFFSFGPDCQGGRRKANTEPGVRASGAPLTGHLSG